MSRFFSRALLTLALSLSLAAPAVAQSDVSSKRPGKTLKKKARRSKAKSKAKKRTTKSSAPAKKAKAFNFEADDIDGSRINPDGTTIFGIPSSKRPSLIRVRAHFLPEILKAAEDL